MYEFGISRWGKERIERRKDRFED
uniref:Uncharacterized protein n=1 Tax=Rhizophora mucronata TaxID=61149 RepID=A0A2P2L4X1_RHIMU